jgi:hypothetical protein
MVRAQEDILHELLQPECDKLFDTVQLTHSVSHMFVIREGMGAAALTHSACCCLEHGLEQRRLLFSLSTSFLKLCSAVPADTNGEVVGKVMAFAWDAGGVAVNEAATGRLQPGLHPGGCSALDGAHWPPLCASRGDAAASYVRFVCCSCQATSSH